MAHCIVSLKLARRFEEDGQVNLEPICTKVNQNESNNRNSETISQKSGKYLAKKRIQLEIHNVRYFIDEN